MYLGNSPTTVVKIDFVYTTVGGETSLSGSDDGGRVLTFDTNQYDVYRNGVLLPASDYSGNGSTVTFIGFTADADDIFVVRAHGTYSISTALEKSDNLASVLDKAAARTNLGIESEVISTASNITLDASHRAKTVRSTQVITLAVTAVATLGTDWYVDIIASGGYIVIDPNASETVNGLSSLIIPLGSAARLICDGSTLHLLYTGRTKFILEHQQSSGTAGGATAATTNNMVPLTATIVNQIQGSSIASNTVTLNAGTYKVDAWCTSFESGDTKLRLYNSSDATFYTGGFPVYTTSASSTLSIFRSEITLASTKDIQLRLYTVLGKAVNGLGRAMSLGTEVYARLEIERIV